MVLDDSPAFSALFLGAMRMGAVPAPVSFLDTTENFAHYARDSYAKLLAAGVTSLILAQAVLNFFAVMGLAPLTGVPLPFVSYGNSNLIVLLGAMGLLLGVAAKSGTASAAGSGRDGRRGGRSHPQIRAT